MMELHDVHVCELALTSIKQEGKKGRCDGERAYRS